MYSPKINEALIPALYRLAKERKMPMTGLVEQFIRDGLEKKERWKTNGNSGKGGE